MHQKQALTTPLLGQSFHLPNNSLANHYCASLLQSLGANIQRNNLSTDPQATDLNNARDWAESGLIPLIGYSDQAPIQGPGLIPSCAKGTLDAIRLISNKDILSGVNGATLLSERAAAMNLQRQGTTSANGSCHLFECSGDWLALNLAREDDWELLAAWLESSQNLTDLSCISELIKQKPLELLIERGRLLGLPVAPATSADNRNSITDNPSWLTLSHSSTGKKTDNKREPLVIDLSSLWAGPLCSHLLQQTGARVVKVESTTRPDGARAGSEQFFNLLNSDKQSIALDLTLSSGIEQLKQLLAQADIIIEGSRPRALKQMGINAEEILKNKPGLIWLSISGYGRQEPEANWVAFGDDAAVASGLAQATSNPPIFCGDAIGDPLTGLHAALAALVFWTNGIGGLLDLSLCNTTKHCLNYQATSAKPEKGIITGTEKAWQLNLHQQQFAVKEAELRHDNKQAASLGHHTQQLLNEFSLSC